MVRSAQISLISPPMVLILCTMIVYAVCIGGHRYDLGVKDQIQIYLKSVLPLVYPSFRFWPMVFIFCTMVAYGL